MWSSWSKYVYKTRRGNNTHVQTPDFGVYEHIGNTKTCAGFVFIISFRYIYICAGTWKLDPRAGWAFAPREGTGLGHGGPERLGTPAGSQECSKFTKKLQYLPFSAILAENCNFFFRSMLSQQKKNCRFLQVLLFSAKKLFFNFFRKLLAFCSF